MHHYGNVLGSVFVPFGRRGHIMAGFFLSFDRHDSNALGRGVLSFGRRGYIRHGYIMTATGLRMCSY